jgi:PAS domain S-box-containing protein
LKIRTRVVIFVVITIVILSAMLFVVLQTILDRNYSQIETDMMQQNLERLTFAIDQEEITLNKLASEWSAWDETYQFVENQNPEYIRNNFVKGTFENSEINLIAIINNSGKVIYAEYYDLQLGQKRPLSDEFLKTLTRPELLAPNIDKGKIGLFKTDQGPLLFGSRAILTSQAQGPVRGTVIFGRVFDSELASIISTVTHLPVSIATIPEVSSGQSPDTFSGGSTQNRVSIKPVDSHTLAGYILVSDIFGQPYLITGTQMARDIYQQGQTIIFLLLFGTAVVDIGIIAMIVLLVDRIVLSRLRILSQFATHISQDADFSSRVALSGKDELKTLANEMNAMLTRISEVNNRLFESETKYSTLVEKSSDGIILISNYQVIYANPRMLQMVGVSASEFFGQDSLSFISSQYRDEVKNRYNLRIKGLTTAESYEIEIDRQDGSSLAVEVSAKTIKLNQQNCDMVIFRDIAERKKAEKAIAESEEKYRSLVNNVKLGIFRSDPSPEGRIIEANRAIERITGYTRQELLNMPAGNLYLNPEERPVFLNEIISTPERANHELTYKKKDHTPIIISATASAVRGQNGQIVYFDTIIEDITERKALEARILELYEKEKIQRQELQEEAQTRALFIDVLAHELRNPLTPIISAAGMLQDLTNNEADNIQKRLISNINSGIGKLTRRLEELLDLARFSRGTIQLNRQPVEIKSFLEEVLARFQPTLDQHHQSLNARIAHDLPPIAVDPSRLDQVMVNLLSNASKYSPESSPIEVAARQQGGDLLIDVTDNGIGISFDDQKQIFQPYHRVGHDGPKVSGLGLGLTISKKIIEAHGGSIRVSSQLGHGSTFSIRIPLKASN